MDNTSGNGGGGGMATSSGGNVTKTNVAYLRTLSAPTPSPSHNIYQQLHHNHHKTTIATKTCGNSSTSAGTCLVNTKPQRNSLAGGVSLFNTTFDQTPLTQPNPNLSQRNFQQQSNEAALNALTAACCTQPTTNGTKSTIAATTTTTTKSSPTTILKIEETSSSAVPQTLNKLSELETLQQKRLRLLNIEMDNIRNTSIDQSQQLSILMQQNHYCTANNNNSNNNSSNHNSINGSNAGNKLATIPANIPKKGSLTALSSLPSNTLNVNCNATGKGAATATSSPLQPHNAATAAVNATNYLMHGSDSTKKGSTSTIWTSEESILRSVGAVDEDNK